MKAGHFQYAFIMLAIVQFIFGGCSSNPQNPGIPPIAEHNAVTTNTDNHMCWGLWQFAADPAKGTLDVVQLRASDMHLNALVFLEPPPLLNLTLESLEFNGNIIDADIGLRHPFLGLTEFTGFDVCGVLITNGTNEGFSDTDLRIAGPGDTRLLNPDGWTRWWNPAEFPLGKTMFNYKDGLLGTPDSIGNYNSTLNAYKYFCDDLANPDDPLSAVNLAHRGMFSAGVKNIRHYQIELGADGLVFNYAVDASWQFPVGQKPWVAPDDFPPEANKVEPWRIDVTELANNLWNDGTSSGGSLKLKIDVYDWLNIDMDSVKVECLALTPTIFDPDPVGGGEGYSIYEVDFTSVSPPQGSVDILVTVESEASGYQDLLPGKNVSAYLIHTAQVNANPGLIVGDLTLKYKCPGNPCAGDMFTVEVSEAYDPGGNPVTITWDFDGNFDFADDMDGDDTNFSGTYVYPDPGDYEAWCRVSNGATFIDGGPLPITIVDCTPNPQIIKTVPYDYQGINVVYNDGYAYISFTDGSDQAGHHGVYIFDVDPVDDANLAGSCTYSLWMEPIAYKDGYCYLGGYYGWGTKTVSVDPPETAHEVDTDDASLSYGSRYGFCVYGNYLYEASQWYGLMIYDISNPANPVLAGMTGPPFPSEPLNWSFNVDVAPETGYAYLVTGHTSLSKVFSVIDISDPASPQVKKSVILTGQPRDVVVRGDYAYVLTDGGLIVLDISDPPNASIAATLPFGGTWNMHLAIEGQYVYAVYGDFSSGSLYIIDVSTPTSPALFMTFPGLPMLARGIDIYCGTCYIAGNGVLDIVDLY